MHSVQLPSMCRMLPTGPQSRPSPAQPLRVELRAIHTHYTHHSPSLAGLCLPNFLSNSFQSMPAPAPAAVPVAAAPTAPVLMVPLVVAGHVTLYMSILRAASRVAAYCAPFADDDNAADDDEWDGADAGGIVYVNR